MEIVYSLWHEMNTYYLRVFHYLNYCISPEHKLHSHYILRYITCIGLIWWSTHIYQILFTVHPNKVCKHKKIWIRLMLELRKIQLLWNYGQFCATTTMAIWLIWHVSEHQDSKHLLRDTKKCYGKAKECPIQQCQETFLCDG
jgi:hypothetical protein